MFNLKRKSLKIYLGLLCFTLICLSQLLYTMQETLPLVNHPPLIQYSERGINPTDKFLRIYNDIGVLNHISYEIAKRGIHSRNIQQMSDAWGELTVFDGTTGNITTNIAVAKDTIGLVRYNRRENAITIVFHGSRNFQDWLTNFNPIPMKARDVPLNFDGTYHEGFLFKYKSCKENLERILSSIVDTLPTNVQSELQFIVSGHSQGAALAHIASIDLTQDFLKRKFGPNFDNKERNKLYGWYLSYLPFGSDDTARNFCETAVGGNNILWHTILYDPIARTGIFSHFQGPGHLALEYPKEVLAKSANHAKEFIQESMIVRKDADYWLQAADITYKIGSFLYNKSITKEAALALAFPKLALAKIVFDRVFYPYHFMEYVNESEIMFNYDLINHPIDALAKGREYQQYYYHPDARELHDAAWKRNYDRVRELLRKLLPLVGQTCYVGYNNGHFITPLHLAAISNDPELLNVLLEGKSAEDLYKSDTILKTCASEGFTPFHSAAYEGNAQVLRHLLNFNHFGRFFTTKSECNIPIHYAAENGHLEAVQVLSNISNEQQHYSPKNIEKHRDNTWHALKVARDKLSWVEVEPLGNKEKIERYKRVYDYLKGYYLKIR